MMKKLLLLFLIILNINIVFAENINNTNNYENITKAQNILFEDCTKIFPMTKENLFYVTLGAINANNFHINEIQTNNGYIIFSVQNIKYLATISFVDYKNSILKITPCNNVYYYPPGIFLNIYKYIELNLDYKA